LSQDIFPPTLYTFLDYALDAEVEKTIIDCGAGGNFPKIALYAMSGFESYGIEISEERMKMAEDFVKKRGLKVHIVKGDMRSLPYESESYGFAYSYNTIFHMNKEDISVAINEMLRVVKKQGLIYVNLLSVDDSRYGIGKESSPGVFTQKEDGEQISHTYFKHNEGDVYFSDYEIIYKQIRVEHLYEWDSKRGMIDYIVKK